MAALSRKMCTCMQEGHITKHSAALQEPEHSMPHAACTEGPMGQQGAAEQLTGQQPGNSPASSCSEEVLRGAALAILGQSNVSMLS